MPNSSRKRSPVHNGFRGHPYFQKAHQRIFTNPLQAEAKYFKTRDFKPFVFSWVLEAAGCRQSSISTTADQMRDGWVTCPSKEEILKCLRAIPEMDAEAMVNRLLLKQYQALPASVRGEIERSGKVKLDFHREQYWGDPGKVAVIAGQKEHDAYFHFVFLTVDIVSDHFRFTIYVTSRVEGFSIATYLPEALAQVRRVMEPRMLVFDGEFSVIDALEYLDGLEIPWDARKSMTKAVKKALRGYSLDPSQLMHRRWHLVEVKGNTPGKSVHVHVMAQKRGKKLKAIIKPVWYSQPPEEAEATYDTRFGIDSGYKEKHSFMARTSSRSWVVRLVLFAISVLLWNVWRLALAWPFVEGLPPLSKEDKRQLSRNVTTLYLAMYFLFEGWKI